MRKRLSRIFLGISLFSFGFVIAVILISNFEWTDISQAAKDYTPVENKSRTESNIQPRAEGSIFDLNQAFVDIANEVTPSIVTIKTEKVVQHPQMRGPWEDFFDEFFRERDMRSTVLGSGVVVKEDGYILTNNHVVAQGEEITVKLYNGKEYQAEEVLTDPRTDIAVVKIDVDGLDAIQIGNSEELQVGEWVLALGNPFDENLQHTVTAGIVSAKGRTDVFNRRQVGDLIQNFIQTDAAINPGNSGGALVNLYGQLVGINTAIATRSGGYQGIGFAIPVNMATNVMNDLIEKGKVVRGYLGVYMEPVDNEEAEALGMDRPYGALVSRVVDGSPADKAGIKVSDVIIGVDGNSVENPGDLQSKISQLNPGEKHTITVIRGGDEKELSVRIGEMPEDMDQQPASAGEAREFGMSLRNITSDLAERFDLQTRSGVLVAEVERGSQAADKGIQPGDIITHVGPNNPVDNLEEYREAIGEYEPGESFLLRLKRGENNFFVGLRVPAEE